ncbi:MAG: GIY-YIG nuclease family protein [Candidatus Paceibacterota bacterium]|jgi:excinuclease ABC subunit C
MNSQYLQKKKLPEAPGVYFFLDKQKKILYIGKATSLRDRVKSYFSSDLPKTRGALIVKMVEEAVSIDYKETASVLEALLLEADLIKKFRPTYNTKEKDDKSFLCVVLTKEDFPQLLTVRKKDLSDVSNVRSVFGPYTNGMQLKDALKIMRKIFPYRDAKCQVCGSAKNKNCKPCFNRQIGLCPGTCAGEISKKEYAKTVRHLETFFSGRIDKLVKDLEKEMKTLAKEKRFEEALVLKNKIYALTHIQDVALIKDDSLRAGDSLNVFRIESYDIAHMGGKNMVGVMTVVSDKMLDKSAYRKFKIKGFDSSNDPGALKEVLTRRLNHPEWPLPSLIVVDGGQAQINVMESVLTERGLSIPVVSVVKDEKHQPRDVMGDQELAIRYRKDILLSNAEAHRFAIGYHKKLRTKNFLV